MADRICAELAIGRSLRSILREDDDLPAMSTIFKWLRENKQFSEQYARAKEEAADAMSEDILEIADDASDDVSVIEDEDGNETEKTNHENIQRSKLRVDTRKWIMSKMKPKKYGDKLDLTSGGDKLPAPIYGGKSVQNTGHNGDKKDIPAP